MSDIFPNMNKNKKFNLKAMAKQTNHTSVANKFEEDFNDFSAMYGLEKLYLFMCDNPDKYYYSGDIMITYSDNIISVTGENALDVITVSCCVLRCIDNLGSMIDQYGRLLHTYFLHTSSNKQATATTESGVRIAFGSADGIYHVGIVK